jgi:uncharacterized membrane protein
MNDEKCQEIREGTISFVGLGILTLLVVPVLAIALFAHGHFGAGVFVAFMGMGAIVFGVLSFVFYLRAFNKRFGDSQVYSDFIKKG